jgi:hypothetical protein
MSCHLGAEFSEPELDSLRADFFIQGLGSL